MEYYFPAPTPSRWMKPPPIPLKHWRTVRREELIAALAEIRAQNLPYRIEADAEGATFKIRIEPKPQPKRTKPRKPLSAYRAGL